MKKSVEMNPPACPRRRAFPAHIVYSSPKLRRKWLRWPVLSQDNVSRDRFSRKRNIKMGMVVPDDLF